MLRWVEALRYKPEGLGFDSRWCQWNFSLTKFFRPHYGPRVYSASNRNEYQEYFLRVKAGGAYCWQLYYLHMPIVWKSGSLNLLKTSETVQGLNGFVYCYLELLITPTKYTIFIHYMYLQWIWLVQLKRYLIIRDFTDWLLLDRAVSASSNSPFKGLPIIFVRLVYNSAFI
jgi:hypothetical protein